MTDFTRQRPYSGPLPEEFPLVEWGGIELETWEDYYRARDQVLDDPDTATGLVEIQTKAIEEEYERFSH